LKAIFIYIRIIQILSIHQQEFHTNFPQGRQ